jgi:hypothetical protein
VVDVIVVLVVAKVVVVVVVVDIKVVVVRDVVVVVARLASNRSSSVATSDSTSTSDKPESDLVNRTSPAPAMPPTASDTSAATSTPIRPTPLAAPFSTFVPLFRVVVSPAARPRSSVGS